MDVEAKRQSYRPEAVRFLMVGESPPTSGRFFYDESGMTRHTCRAFEIATGRQFSSTRAFLDYFRNCGFYLDDLSHRPVDKVASSERESILRAEIENFSDRVERMDPEVVIIVLRKIEPLIRDALKSAGSRAQVHVLPFPGQGHQNKYVAQLSRIISEFTG